jgi:hypothetical protein
VKVTVKAERLEGFWRDVTRQWNRQVLNKVPGSQDLLLTEEEWLTLWRGILATRCHYIDPEREYPRYRVIVPKRCEVPLLMWEALWNFGIYRSKWGADYVITAEAEWPSQEEMSRVYAKWLNALSAYLAVLEMSRSLPSDVDAAPSFVVNVVERGGGVTVQSSYPMEDVTPRHTLWAAIALPPVPDYGPPRTVYMEWDRTLITHEILRGLREEDG